MLDRITELQKGKSATAVKCVTLSEDILHDHFPDLPVFPGALLVEAMAQLGGFLLEMSLNRPGQVRRALLAQIDQAKFYRPAEPGDRMVLHAEIAEQMEDAVKVNVKAELSGEKISTAKLTFVLKEIASGRIHDQRRYFYTLWTRRLSSIPEIL
jgi:3-hydroxyacyl-[acyl-carrier-protein] dehydratase